MTSVHLARLASVLAALPLEGLPPRLLEIGCGEGAAFPTLRQALPGWRIVGLDWDWAALLRARHADPAPVLLCADARSLPGLLCAHFGLILVRHPDLFRPRAGLDRVIPALAGSLAPGGVLLVTLYAPEEADRLRSWSLPPRLLLDESRLAPPALDGQDRLVFAFRSARI